MTVFTYKERVLAFADDLARLIAEAQLHLSPADLARVLKEAADKETATNVS